MRLANFSQRLGPSKISLRLPRSTGKEKSSGNEDGAGSPSFAISPLTRQRGEEEEQPAVDHRR